MFVNEWTDEQSLEWLYGKRDVKKDVRKMDIVNAFDTLLSRHGHRCVKEAEFRNEDWGENPIVLVQLLKNSVKAQLKVNNSNISETKKNARNEDKEEDKLEVLLKHQWSHVHCLMRPVLRYAVNCARSGVQRREMSKSLQVKVHSSMKRCFRWLGQLMVKEDILNGTYTFVVIYCSFLFFSCNSVFSASSNGPYYNYLFFLFFFF